MSMATLVLIGALIFSLPLHAQETSAGQAVPPDVMKQIEALTKRVEQLEQQLQKEHEAASQANAVTPSAKATAPPPVAVPPAVGQPAVMQNETAAAQPAKTEKIAPFSDWDWTWLNGNPRNKDTAWDSKFFTPEIRADITYAYDFSKPIDETNSGSSEIFRTNEIQLEQLGIGGDFHWTTPMRAS